MQQYVLPAQGKVNYLEALEVAIQREIKSKYMYQMMARFAKTTHLKNKLEFLALEEKNHWDNLEDLYKKISGKKGDFESLVSYPQEEKAKGMAEMEMTELLKIAIAKESEANGFYVDLARSTDDQGMRDLFNYLAEEEITHRRMLEVEMRLYTGERPMGNERSVEMVPGVYKEWW